MTPDEMTTTLAAHEDCCTETVQGDQVTWTCGVVTLWGITDAAMSRAHLAAVLAATVTEAQAGALREAADEFWRIFLRLPHTPSPLGDYIQRRVLEFRARADSLVERAERGQG